MTKMVKGLEREDIFKVKMSSDENEEVLEDEEEVLEDEEITVNDEEEILTEEEEVLSKVTEKQTPPRTKAEEPEQLRCSP